MLRIFAVLIVLLAVATVPAAAQVADADAAAWFHGATCPATWVTLTPPETRTGSARSLSGTAADRWTHVDPDARGCRTRVDGQRRA